MPQLTELLGGLGPILSNVFDCMEIAEEEIARARRRAADSETRSRLHSAFRFLAPSELLQGKDLELYRTHARELLCRVARREPLEPGTRAEVLAGLAEASLAAPPDPVGSLLYFELFAEIFPSATEHHYAHPYRGESYYEEEAAALLERLRRRIARDRDCQTSTSFTTDEE